VSEVPEGFGPPDWDAAIDVEGRLAGAPEDGWVRGMFFQGLVDFVRSKTGKTVGRERYLAFKTYPLREYIALLATLASAAFPDVPAREGLRRLGHRAYPNLMSSTFGRVLFSVAANDFGEALRLVGRVYRMVANPGRVLVARLEPGLALLELRHMWTFADAYQVGVFEGGMRTYRREGEVEVRVKSLSEVDLWLRWR
jgi:uncharacterized protein (TIGR02265 family)